MEPHSVSKVRQAVSRKILIKDSEATLQWNSMRKRVQVRGGGADAVKM